MELALDADRRSAWEQGCEHLTSCSACREWVEARSFQVRALSSLTRRSLPGELSQVVGSDLSEREAALARVLRSLPRMEAPAALDRAVASSLRSTAGVSHTGRGKLDPARSRKSVRALAYETVPPVLERLVDEELAAPGRHLAERFVGGLERVPAPAALDRRVSGLFRRPAPRRLAAALAVAASLVLVWRFAIPREPTFERTLRRVHVQDPGQLGSVARGLVEGLGGGVPSAVNLRPGEER